MNKQIKIIRPALTAAVIGFAWAISTAVKPYGVDHGYSYLGNSLAMGIVWSLMALIVVSIWQGARRYLTKPVADQISENSKLGLFAVFDSDADELAAIKAASWLIITMSCIAFAIRLFTGNIGSGIVDAVLMIGLAVAALRLHSRVAALLLLVLSAASAFATGHTRFFGGEGGANLLMAIFMVWASARLVAATFRLQSHGTLEPEATLPGRTQMAAGFTGAAPIESHNTMQQKTTGHAVAIASEGGIMIAPSTSQPQTPSAIDEDRIYEEIARELETGATDKGLWTRLFAECNGDENQTKVLYIKQRAEKLISAERLRLAEIAQAHAAEAERLERLRITKEKEKEFLTAVWEGSISKADQLIREGIKPGHLRDDTGRSAYDLAKERGDQQMIQLLHNYNKLETQRAEQGLMTEFGITFDGERYHFQDYRYDKLTDAIKYTQTQKTRNEP